MPPPKIGARSVRVVAGPSSPASSRCAIATVPASSASQGSAAPLPSGCQRPSTRVAHHVVETADELLAHVTSPRTPRDHPGESLY